MESSKSIEDLPNDVLVEILSYVSFNDLIHSVQHVCTRWREVSGDIMLWRNRVYSPAYGESDVNIAGVLEQTPKLRTLIINERGVRSMVLRALAQHCPHLRKLIFFEHQRLSVKFLKVLVSKCPNIESLSIPHMESSNLTKMKVIGRFSNLKDVCLGGWADREKPVVLKPLADGCPSLQRLDLKGKMVMYDDFAYFLLKKKDQLESLDIKWGSADWKCLIPPLTLCTRLRKLLIIDYSHLNIEAGFQALGSLHFITSLTLNYVNDADINCVTSVFKKNGLKQLEELRIIGYDSYDDRLADVIVKNCSKLKLLFLKDCFNLSDQSVKNFHLLHHLESVNLSSAGITDAGVASLTKCTKLKYLSLKHCGFLTETSMKLMIEFSNLRILKLDSCNIKGLPINLFSSHLPCLTLFSINFCRNIDQEALALLKTKKPQLVVYDYFDAYDSGEEDYDDEPIVGVDPVDEEPMAEAQQMYIEGQVVIIEAVEPVADEANSIEDEDLELLLGVESLFDIGVEKEVWKH
ncbi:F-box/LRR-repeat protein fbxl-1 [Anabrus simplex]|uniref:F-box/LRR-repeat protein fbxl-1 n=1 Tax=Anabrus simplex TaxID=316456 RepID=UPI0034DDB97E